MALQWTSLARAARPRRAPMAAQGARDVDDADEDQVVRLLSRSNARNMHLRLVLRTQLSLRSDLRAFRLPFASPHTPVPAHDAVALLLICGAPPRLPLSLPPRFYAFHEC